MADLAQASQPTIKWDKATKKLSNHYTKSAIMAMMAGLRQSDELAYSKDKTYELSEADSTQFTMKIARLLGLYPRCLEEVPSPLKKWCLRVLRMYVHKDLFDAWHSNTLSTRNALDMADYVHTLKYRDLYEQALAGDITNPQFRKLKKERS